MSWNRRHRRALATILAILWLVGIEALPALHLAAHDDDHTHAPDGTIVPIVPIVRVTFGGHRHADGTMHGDHGALEFETAAPRKRRGRPIDQLAIRTPNDHAATGIAHHAAALQSPPPPILALAVERIPLDVAEVRIGQPPALVLARANARGPPA